MSVAPKKPARTDQRPSSDRYSERSAVPKNADAYRVSQTAEGLQAILDGRADIDEFLEAQKLAAWRSSSAQSAADSRSADSSPSGSPVSRKAGDVAGDLEHKNDQDLGVSNAPERKKSNSKRATVAFAPRSQPADGDELVAMNPRSTGNSLLRKIGNKIGKRKASFDGGCKQYQKLFQEKKFQVRFASACMFPLKIRVRAGSNESTC
jgi:hypothetical protein